MYILIFVTLDEVKTRTRSPLKTQNTQKININKTPKHSFVMD